MISRIDFWRPDEIKGLVLHRGARATHPHPRHWHEELHLCLYTAGSGFLGCRGNSYTVSAGSLVLMPPGEVHENWVKKDSGCSFRGVYFEVELLRRAARDHLHRVFDQSHLTRHFLRLVGVTPGRYPTC